jgi:hypothetical protein
MTDNNGQEKDAGLDLFCKRLYKGTLSLFFFKSF